MATARRSSSILGDIANGSTDEMLNAVRVYLALGGDPTVVITSCEAANSAALALVTRDRLSHDHDASFLAWLDRLLLIHRALERASYLASKNDLAARLADLIAQCENERTWILRTRLHARVRELQLREQETPDE